MAEICLVGERCDACPFNELAPDDQFPVWVDVLVGAEGEMPLPPGEVGINITGDDVVRGLAKRMELKNTTAAAVRDLRNNGICTKVN